MQVITLPSLSAPPEPRPSLPPAGTVVTIGAYDGVHRGHRDLIARTRSTAATLGCATAVVTFDRHPATVVRPGSAPLLLTDPEQKLELLAETGVDLTVLVHFDAERAAEPPESFVGAVLVDLLAVRSVVVGHDFHFGRARAGNVELLQRLGADLGFDVTGLRLLAEGEAPVSSTRIRGLVAAGRVEEAAALLGRPHQVRGRVEHGDQRGRELGYPTANVAVPPGIALPADGVYAGRYHTPDGAAVPACISVGRRPTYYEQGPPLVEAHLLDFAGDLYGQATRVDFVAFQRGQVRFDSGAELVAQMARDVEETRRLLR